MIWAEGTISFEKGDLVCIRSVLVATGICGFKYQIEKIEGEESLFRLLCTSGDGTSEVTRDSFHRCILAAELKCEPFTIARYYQGLFGYAIPHEDVRRRYENIHLNSELGTLAKQIIDALHTALRFGDDSSTILSVSVSELRKLLVLDRSNDRR